MSLFDLFPEEDANRLDEALRAPNQPPQPTSMFSGLPTAVPKALASSVGKIAAPISEFMSQADLRSALSPTPLGTPSTLPTEDPKVTAREQAMASQRMVQSFQPDARTNGAIANTLFGLTDVGSRALVGFAMGGPVGSAALAGGSEGFNTMRQAQANNVDDKTAANLGIVSGALTAGGVFMPIVGKTLPTQLTSGALGNVALGALSRGASSKILADAGYPQMAEQYHWLDAQDTFSDLLLGLAFGGIHHFFSPSAIDTAMAAKDQVHTELDSAPGIPKTPEARSDHDLNMRAALRQKLDDEPVTGMRPVETVPNPAQEATRDATVVEAAKIADEAMGERVEAPVEPERIPEQVPLQVAEEQPKSLLSRSGRQEQAKATEAELMSTLQPDTVDALTQAKSDLADMPKLKIEDEETGNEVSASDAMAKAMDGIRGAKDEGVLHQIAAACAGRG